MPSKGTNNQGIKHKSVVNLSQRKLSDTEMNVLSLGMNFATTLNMIQVAEFIQATEPFIRKLEKQKADVIRVQIHKVLNHSEPPKSNLTRIPSNTHPKDWQG